MYFGLECLFLPHYPPTITADICKRAINTKYFLCALKRLIHTKLTEMSRTMAGHGTTYLSSDASHKGHFISHPYSSSRCRDGSYAHGDLFLSGVLRWFRYSYGKSQMEETQIVYLKV